MEEDLEITLFLGERTKLRKRVKRPFWHDNWRFFLKGRSACLSKDLSFEPGAELLTFISLPS